MNSHRSRCGAQAGIAIGPILFIIAILAILATAIAAGSGTFASNSQQEANRTNAAELIQIGQSLKLGVDRIVSLCTALSSVDINNNTTANNSIFSPMGGGLVQPSVALANNPSTDHWVYTWGNVTNLGSASLERLALIPITQGVCDQLQSELKITTVDVANGVGNGTLGAFSNTTNLADAWPSSMAGRMSGCIYNDTNTSYYFYQVLGVQ